MKAHHPSLTTPQTKAHTKKATRIYRPVRNRKKITVCERNKEVEVALTFKVFKRYQVVKKKIRLSTLSGVKERVAMAVGGGPEPWLEYV